MLLELALAGRRRLDRRLPERPARARASRSTGPPSAGDLDTALPLYRALHPLLRWDSKTEFVQAIKLSMDLAGRHGGPCRPPRVAAHRRARGRGARGHREGASPTGHR